MPTTTSRPPGPSTPRPRPTGSERGSTVPLIAAGLLLAAVLALGVVRLGDAAARRARIDAVADLVALAAVTGGDGSAQRVAEANGTALRALRRDGDTVVATVVADGTVAVAAARPSGG